MKIHTYRAQGQVLMRDSALLCNLQLVGLKPPCTIIASLGISHYSGSTSRCCGYFDYFRADFIET